MTTQWHHFVRSKTQISKRLYWLKRPAGCEIRQPVNIIELEEILSEQAREEEDRGSDSEDEGVCTSLGVTTKKEDEKKANQRSIGSPSKMILKIKKTMIFEKILYLKYLLKSKQHHRQRNRQ